MPATKVKKAKSFVSTIAAAFGTMADSQKETAVYETDEQTTYVAILLRQQMDVNPSRRLNCCSGTARLKTA